MGPRPHLAAGWIGCGWPQGSTGPYLPQAVIAALHATAPSWEQTDWTTICTAYDRLVQLTDSPVVRANRALAVGLRDGPDAGLAALDKVAHDPRLARSNLVATVRADLLRRAGRTRRGCLLGTERRWSPTVLSPAATSCGGASPSAAGNLRSGVRWGSCPVTGRN